MATWKKIITSGSNADLNQITASAVKFPNDSIPIASLAEDAITIAGTSTALGGSITADTIAGQISADTISGNQINGGTIGSITISALAGALSLGDNNITNVGDINADSISVDAAGTGLNVDFSGGNTTKNKITLADDLADALNITEGSNSYIKFTTTDSSEKILVSKNTEFVGNVSGSSTSTGSFGLLQGDGSELTGVQQDIDSLDAFSGVPHATQDEFLISDNGTEKRATMTMVANGAFALVSGEATIAAGGALTIAANVIGNNELKQDDDITLQSLTTTNNVTIGGDLTVNGTTTTIATTNAEVKDQFLLLASGSSGTNVDAGILAQSGSSPGTGSAFYHDISDQRWSVGKSLAANRTAATAPTQFVTTVKTDSVNPSSESGSYGAGEMHVNTSTGEIWIRFG
tara:strand:- start:245 stop:1459 length:1215 start_codon:yes stop_codon:yes gene_type:complete